MSRLLGSAQQAGRFFALCPLFTEQAGLLHIGRANERTQPTFDASQWPCLRREIADQGGQREQWQNSVSTNIESVQLEGCRASVCHVISPLLFLGQNIISRLFFSFCLHSLYLTCVYNKIF